MAELFEALMVVSFGVSWPLSIVKSYRARTAKGKSILFLLCILFGYGMGIVSKLVSGRITYVFFFYILNAVMVSGDVLLYLRNRRIDAQRGRAAAEAPR